MKKYLLILLLLAGCSSYTTNPLPVYNPEPDDQTDTTIYNPDIPSISDTTIL